MIFARNTKNELLHNLPELTQQFSQNSFFTYILQSMFNEEKATFILFHLNTNASVSMVLKVESQRSGNLKITVENMGMEKDKDLELENPDLHDVALIELMLCSMRILIGTGDYFGTSQISFRLPQEEAQHLLCFDKLFSSITDVYSKDHFLTTFKMPINQGLQGYFIAMQSKILTNLHQ